jgi:hypothetical protein
MAGPPNFWSVFAEALRLSASRRSLVAFMPWWLLICIIVPPFLVFLASSHLRGQISENSVVTVFSAIAVVAGFFGSVSISTMAQVQRMTSEYPFSDYLRHEELFDLYLFWPQFTLLIQICLLLLSASGAAFIRLFEFDDLNRYLIAIDLGLLIYVCTKTWNLIELIRSLTWHYAEYQQLLAAEKRHAGES